MVRNASKSMTTEVAGTKDIAPSGLDDALGSQAALQAGVEGLRRRNRARRSAGGTCITRLVQASARARKARSHRALDPTRRCGTRSRGRVVVRYTDPGPSDLLTSPGDRAIAIDKGAAVRRHLRRARSDGLGWWTSRALRVPGTPCLRHCNDQQEGENRVLVHWKTSNQDPSVFTQTPESRAPARSLQAKDR